MRSVVRRILLLAVAMVPAVTGAARAEPAPAAAGDKAPRAAPDDGSPRVVLDTTSFWRAYHVLAGPVAQGDDGICPVPLEKQWAMAATAPPAADWATPGFDDSTWLRGPARIAIRTPFLARLLMRGKFIVSDPAQVADLKLSVTYHGGIVVRVNGREVARRHLPEGAAPATMLAEPYPLEAFVLPDGQWLQHWDAGKGPGAAEAERRVALRRRRLSEVVIPASLLSKGTNVVALEIVRAPYHKIVLEKKIARSNSWQRRTMGAPYTMNFGTCQFSSVQLTAAGPAGIEPNVVRPQGVQVWTSDVLAADFDMDWGDPAEPPRPVRIVARNGAFSGKVVVGSTDPIRGLRATVSDLAGPGGRCIPASAVEVRYAAPWGMELGVYENHYGNTDVEYPRYRRSPVLLGALEPEPPDLVAVAEKRPGRADVALPGGADPVLGAVVPIWLTVSVPRDAATGTYQGRVAIRLDGRPAAEAPLELKVARWTLPDTQDWRTWVELTQSPDTLALEYGVEPWSDRHFELIARSLDLVGRTGSRVLYVPLIARTNLGNEQSMVRWIAKGEDRYEYDFSVMDRYLDVAAQHMGRPRIVCFVAWDIYLIERKQIKGSFDREFKEVIKAREALRGVGPAVTVLDPATGATETVYLKPFADPSARKLWQPLFDELRRRMRRRGLEKEMMLGLVSDAWPTPAENKLFEAMAPGVPWVSHSHLGVRHGKQYSGANFTNCPINTAYETRIINTEFAYDDPDSGSLGGWALPLLVAQHERHAARFPAARWRHIAELNITGRQRGIGRLGADVWPVVKDRRGWRRGRVDQRYPESFWRNLNLVTSLLAPGRAGAVATYRFEALREGVQECEARIVIERAVADDRLRAKLGSDLADRCRALLVERTQHLLKASMHLLMTGDGRANTTADRVIRRAGVAGHYWFVGSGWQERTAALFGLAGEVERRSASHS